MSSVDTKDLHDIALEGLGIGRFSVGKPHPYARYSLKISRSKHETSASLPSIPRDGKSIRIGCVSLPEIKFLTDGLETTVVKDGSREDSSVDHAACKRVLVKYNSQTARKLNAMLYNSIRALVQDHGCDVVCANELSFPVVNNQHPNQNLQKRLCKMAKDHNCLIVAGSFHDPRTLYNSAPVFFPGCGPSGLLYHKQVSATRLNPEHTKSELVSVPSHRIYPVFKIYGIGIAVLTCLDVLDFSTVASVVQTDSECDMVVIPVYSSSNGAIKDSAEELSKAMPGVVVTSNYYQPGEIGATMSIFGSKEDPNERSIKSVNEKGEFSVFDLALDQFKSNLSEKKNTTSQRHEWLFGLTQQHH